jgi:hypothetical protein
VEAPGILTCRLMAIVGARKILALTGVPSTECFVAKTQDFPLSGRKYRDNTHRAPLVGCLRRVHRKSICQMCESIDEKVAFAAEWR